MKRGLHGAVAMLLVMLLLITSMPMAALAEIVKVDTSSGIQPFSILPGDTKVLTYEFYVGENSAPVSTQRVREGDVLVEPVTPDGGAGKKFTGWYTENNELFTGFGTIGAVAESATIKLYAWFEEVYYVFFMDGVDPDARVIATKEGISGASISVADVNVPVGANQSVSGWYYDAEWNHPVENNTVTLENENIRLYPKIEDGHWITFDSDGGTYVEPMFVQAGTTPSKPATPNRPGYVFIDWVDENGYAFSFNQPITQNTELKATWHAGMASYTIIYWLQNADDDDYTFDSIRRTNAEQGMVGSTITLQPSQYHANRLAASDRNYFEYSHYDQDVEIKGDGTAVVNVYFNRKEYTVTFGLGNRDGHEMTIGNVTYQSGRNKRQYSFTARYGADISQLWPTASNFSTGDNFYGWSLNNKSEAISVSKRLTMTSDLCLDDGLRATAQYGVNCSDHLFYMFESIDQSSPANGNNRHFYNGKYYDRSEAYSQDARSTGGDWNLKVIEGMKSLRQQTEILDREDSFPWSPTERNVFLYYDRERYTLGFYNYNKEDKTESNIMYGQSIGTYNYTPDRPSELGEHYTFDGWYTTSDLIQKFEWENATMPASNMILYAKWVPNTFTVTAYRSMDLGESDVYQSLEGIEYGAAISEYENTWGHPTIPENYEWRGWRILNEDGTLSPSNFNTQITRDIELYPYYTPAGYFTVTYSAGDGSGSVTDNGHYAADSYADVKSGAELEPPEGQVFLYWQVEGSDTKYYPNDKIYITGDVELIAIYGPTPEGTNITYVLNYPGAETQQRSISLINNAAHTVLNWNDSQLSFGVTVDGYEFVGWSTTQHDPADDIDSEVNYPVGTEIIVNKSNDDRENILYGCWKPKKGTLVIEKILPEAGGGGKQFTFVVRKQGNNEVVRTVTVTVNGTSGSETITLPEGMYTVTEKLQNNQDYYEQPEEQTVTVRRGDEERVIFTNTLKKYTVTIEKQVTGNMYNTNDEFEFKATVTFEDMPYRIQGSNDNEYKVDEDGTITFTLKGGQSVVLLGIPKHAIVTVEETDRKDYETSYQMGSNDPTKDSTATINVQSDMSVTFINDKTVTIDTGVNLDVLPYLLMLAVAGGAVALLLVLKRRKTQE